MIEAHFKHFHIAHFDSQCKKLHKQHQFTRQQQIFTETNRTFSVNQRIYRMKAFHVEYKFIQIDCVLVWIHIFKRQTAAIWVFRCVGKRTIEIQNNKIIEASNRLTYKQTQHIHFSLAHTHTHSFSHSHADDDKYLHFNIETRYNFVSEWIRFFPRIFSNAPIY